MIQIQTGAAKLGRHGDIQVRPFGRRIQKVFTVEWKIQGLAGTVVRFLSSVTALMAFLVVLPLMLWFAWVLRSTVIDSLFQVVLCMSFAWAVVSMLQAQRSLRRLGSSSSDRMRLFSGSRPDNPDKFRAWKWAWQFMYAVIGVLISMIAIPVTAWITGKRVPDQMTLRVADPLKSWSNSPDTTKAATVITHPKLIHADLRRLRPRDANHVPVNLLRDLQLRRWVGQPLTWNFGVPRPLRFSFLQRVRVSADY